MQKNIDYDLRAINDKWMTEALVMVVALMLLMFVTWVTFSVEILPQAKPRIEVQIENIPQTQQTSAAPPPERPAIPIESEDEDLPDDVTISSTTIDFTEQSVAPPTVSSGEEEEIPEFVAFDKAPEVTKQVTPEYPEIARRAGIEGDVWLRVPIDTSGNVIASKIKVVKNSTGNSGCVEAAIAAASQYKLSPAYQRDRPVRVWISLPFKFRLKDK